MPAKGAEVLVSDTVGFVKKLPHQLVASFKATLEEAFNADLLLHIIDVSSPDALKQIKSVNNVLKEIGCGEKPILEVLNKVDVVRNISDLEILQTLYRDAVSISARTGFGLENIRAPSFCSVSLPASRTERSRAFSALTAGL